MRSFAFAAIAAIVISLPGTLPAEASGWQSRMLGIPQDNAAAVQTWKSRNGTRSATRSTRNQRTASARRSSTRSANRRTRSQTRRTRQVSGSALRGLASYYWQPQRVASGGWFNPNALTAAHKTLPFGTRVRVTNLRNGRSVVVRINDRGPYIRGRIIDLSRRAATVVGMRGAGVVPVSVEILG